jgi:hypothetical protein
VYWRPGRNEALRALDPSDRARLDHLLPV